MEGGAVTTSEPKEVTLEEQLDLCAEYYMGLGVPYDEFWYGDYCRLKYYESAYLKRRKIENENMWLQGAYIYNAFSTSLANAFRKKGTSFIPYLKEPYDIFPKSEIEKEVEKQQQIRKVVEALNSFKANWDRKHDNSRT